MAAIHENLKRIRRERGLTQEEAAQKLSVTRQTISSYESGRTQPDLETLKRLAEIYAVSFDNVLYGDSVSRRGHRSLKLVAVILLVCVFLTSLVPSLMLWYANQYLHVEPGLITEVTRPIVEQRIALNDLREAVQALGMVLCVLLALFAFFVTLLQPLRIGWKRKMLYFAALVVAVLLGTLPCAILGQRFSLVDYLLGPMFVLGEAAILLLLSFPGECFVRWMRGRSE